MSPWQIVLVALAGWLWAAKASCGKVQAAREMSCIACESVLLRPTGLSPTANRQMARDSV